MRLRDRDAPQRDRQATAPTLTPELVASRLHALARRDRYMLALATAAFVFIAVLNILALTQLNENTDQLENLARANRTVLAVQVPTLRARIAERDRTIEDLQAVNDQAVDWILKLADQIEALGGEPPRIELRPPRREPADP